MMEGNCRSELDPAVGSHESVLQSLLSVVGERF